MCRVAFASSSELPVLKLEASTKFQQSDYTSNMSSIRIPKGQVSHKSPVGSGLNVPTVARTAESVPEKHINRGGGSVPFILLFRLLAFFYWVNCGFRLFSVGSVPRVGFRKAQRKDSVC